MPRTLVNRQENNPNNLILACPHCSLLIQIPLDIVCCGIFRHAIFRNTYEHVNPHLSKESCEQLLTQEKVYGCCKPFQLVREGGEWKFAEECDYI